MGPISCVAIPGNVVELSNLTIVHTICSETLSLVLNWKWLGFKSFGNIWANVPTLYFEIYNQKIWMNVPIQYFEIYN